MRTFASLRLVTATMFRLARREPASLLVAVVGALVVAGLFLSLGLVSARTAELSERRTFRLAVPDDPTDLAGAEEFMAELGRDPQLVVTPVPDVAQAVIDGKAAVGIDPGPDTDARLTAGDDLDLRVFVRERQEASLDGFGQLWVAVDEVRMRRIGAEIPSTAVVVTTVEVQEDERANQVRLTQVLAAMLCLLSVRLVSGTAAVLGRAGEARAGETLLLLPLDRRIIAGGLAAGTTPLHALHLAIALGVVLGAALLPLPDLGLQLSTVASMLPAAALGVALIGITAAAVGALAGALGSGSEDTVAMGDLLALPFVAIGLILLSAPPATAAGGAAFAVPVLGPALVVRDGMVGEITLLEAAVAVMSTALVVAATITVAARVMGNERRVLRVTI